jgi:hypothetical protein
MLDDDDGQRERLRERGEDLVQRRESAPRGADHGKLGCHDYLTFR